MSQAFKIFVQIAKKIYFLIHWVSTSDKNLLETVRSLYFYGPITGFELFLGLCFVFVRHIFPVRNFPS